MLAHQRTGVLRTGLQRCACRGIGIGITTETAAQRVAQGHRNVAQPAFMANAAYGAALGALQKFVFSPCKEVRQLLPRQPITRVKVGQSTALGKLVPGTHQLAIVTAINPVASKGRISGAIEPAYSMVRYEIQRRASNR